MLMALTKFTLSHIVNQNEEETHPLLSILGLDIVLTHHNVVCLIVNFVFKIGLTITQYTPPPPTQCLVNQLSGGKVAEKQDHLRHHFPTSTIINIATMKTLKTTKTTKTQLK